MGSKKIYFRWSSILGHDGRVFKTLDALRRWEDSHYALSTSVTEIQDAGAFNAIAKRYKSAMFRNPLTKALSEYARQGKPYKNI